MIKETIEKFFQTIPLARTLYKCALQRIFKHIIKHKGENILEEDFDYLIILDACRYDIFKEVNFIEGELTKKISLGSQTGEWTGKTFKKKYNDIVYIAGTPMIHKERTTGNDVSIKNWVYKLEDVWRYGWDKKYKTTLPHTVREATLRLIDDYPTKRFVIHFIQPHYPFLKLDASTNDGHHVSDTNPFELAKKGKLKKEKIIKLYKDNLIFVLKEIEKLINNLKGRIIITSDHGEAFGEKFLWEHKSELYIKELIEVPWLVIDKSKKNKEEEMISVTINQIRL